MVLLNRENALKKERVLSALESTFETRQTHPMPVELVPPPPEWDSTFTALASECGLKMYIQEAFGLLSDFFRSVRKG